MHNRSLVAAAVAALSLGLAGSAFAQRHDDRDHGRGDDRSHRSGPPHRDDHRFEGRRGAGPEHNFYQGGRLPSQWRARQYVVDDWRGHHLRPPPRGYHWVQAGGDYVLAAIATGVIASIIINSQ